MREINEIYSLIEAARRSGTKSTAQGYLQKAVNSIANIEDHPDTDGGMIRRLYQEVKNAAYDLGISIYIPYL